MFFRTNGINVPLFYKTKDNKYYTQYDFDDGTYLIWCEEKLPYESMDKVNKENISLSSEFYSMMGSLVGRMHSVSKNNKISYP
ncbi:hypothetical protein [Oceanirhabdus sp. W0125-5]|uniref:hypothetical protein n=1 Tax=Oceanirhabdus sp. W0125-5 TaxID=2999116 RepID=UPI0022F2EFB5|nr:hypothetical protein [Oceanirhabdus sp. W0125-5]WBW99299.1 hypothetical protein OW730_11270 [Oceanirhabdus sp. W0125-5]